ncbi:MAG: hypothetical protein Q8S84_00520 [bacterium]|nr:hypothetical protein [bacterium]MDP3380072.1 hypothetical protein [bacterium]
MSFLNHSSKFTYHSIFHFGTSSFLYASSSITSSFFHINFSILARLSLSCSIQNVIDTHFLPALAVLPIR